MIEKQIAYIRKMLAEGSRNSEKVENSSKQAHEADSLLHDFKLKFIDYLLGYEIPEISLDSICFPKRFLNVNSISQLPSQQEDVIRNIVFDCFNLGFACHFIFMKSPKRGREINCGVLFDKFLSKSPIADMMLKKYNKDLSNYPEKIFNYYYKNETAPRLRKHFSFGYFKKQRVRGLIKNYYYCGILLGLMSDIEAQ